MAHKLTLVRIDYTTMRAAVKELRQRAANSFANNRPEDGAAIASIAARLDRAAEYGEPLRTHYSTLTELTHEEAVEFVRTGTRRY